MKSLAILFLLLCGCGSIDSLNPATEQVPEVDCGWVMRRTFKIWPTHCERAEHSSTTKVTYQGDDGCTDEPASFEPDSTVVIWSYLLTSDSHDTKFYDTPCE